MGYMWRQIRECGQGTNSIGWVGPSGHGNTNVVEIVGTETPSDKDVPRPSMDTSLFRHYTEVLGYYSSMWIAS
jgi:hypothetical protein